MSDSQQADRIYLDNAATSWPKPEGVYQACDHYLRTLGAPAGRSAYDEATQVAERIAALRLALVRLIGGEHPKQLSFWMNGTQALNQALFGLLQPGDHVVTTVTEHNSVLRPLRHLEETASLRVTRVPCDEHGLVDPAAISAELRDDTRLVALNHVSNVTGAVQPAEQVGELLADHPAKYLLDAAQSLGHLPIHVRDWHIDLLAAPGHKGLLGPLGTGLLYVRPGLEAELTSLIQGGTGSVSEQDRQPESLPDKFESGNHNAVGLVGLEAGVAWLAERSIEAVREHLEQLTASLLAGLSKIDGVTLYGPPNASQRAGVVSLNIQGYDPQEVALLLDSGYHIQVRSGLHCAPLMHLALGTLPSGTVRFSVGAFNTPDDVQRAVAAVREIAGAAMVV